MNIIILIAIIVLIVIGYLITLYISNFIIIYKFFRFISKLQKDLSLYYIRKPFVVEGKFDYTDSFKCVYSDDNFTLEVTCSQKDLIDQMYYYIYKTDKLIENLSEDNFNDTLDKYYELRHKARAEKLQYEGTTD